MRVVLQAVGPRIESYFDQKLDARESRLVVIGQAGLDLSAIAESLKS